MRITNESDKKTCFSCNTHYREREREIDRENKWARDIEGARFFKRDKQQPSLRNSRESAEVGDAVTQNAHSGASAREDFVSCVICVGMYRHVLCLVLGLIVGMQLTQFWDYITFTTEEYESTALAGDTTLSSSSSSLAEQLYRKTRVLCLVLTMPSNHATKAQMVKQTWGSRCNKLVFMSSQDDAQLGAVNLNVTETRANLYNKVRAGLAYAYEHYGEDYDWFLKADDDT